MAAATKAARGRIWIKETPPSALYPMPITTATPRMISQMGLVCLPAATNAGAGRRIASMKAHTSTTSAASERASKNQKRGVSAPTVPNTVPDYPLLVTIRARCGSLVPPAQLRQPHWIVVVVATTTYVRAGLPVRWGIGGGIGAAGIGAG